MARDRKRVRIQSGHQERIIERRSQRSKRHSLRKSPTKKRMRSVMRRSHDQQPHWYCKTHRPTVAQVVYQFLERASNSNQKKSQKSNATNQFRQLQRRKTSKRLRPDLPKKIRPKIEAVDLHEKEEYKFPYSKLPTVEGEKSIEKCIYEVLSFGTVLGLLVPVDKEGMTFRVSSDVELFNHGHKKDQARKRNDDIPEYNQQLLEEKCECKTKCN